MDETNDPGSVLGSWKEWARYLKAEINRFNTELKELHVTLANRVSDIYTRIDNRHDTVHTLLTGLEGRIRAEIAQLQVRVSTAVDRDALNRIQDQIDTAAEQSTVSHQEVRIRELEQAITALKTACQIWGVLAGAAAALVVVLIEWWLNRN